MAEKRQETLAIPAAGGISLLTVFAVLCLTVFALLSLSTVQADVRLSQASVQAVEDYYAADRQAQAVLAQLRWGEITEEITMVADYGAWSGGPGWSEYSYAVPISDTLELQVEVALDGSDYEVLRWQAVPVGEWEIDDGLELWDGEEFLD